VERHSVALVEHAAHERRGAIGDVAIDQEEGRVNLLVR
jgi:hypothetical protein